MMTVMENYVLNYYFHRVSWLLILSPICQFSDFVKITCNIRQTGKKIGANVDGLPSTHQAFHMIRSQSWCF